ncbi:MAG: retropepsin-like domain-containing protein [Clostridiales bacterium]|nr:retropepsin-like domain-containing protein [Clostridiales bacterium]
MILSAFTKRYTRIENKLISSVLIESDDPDRLEKPIEVAAQWDTGSTGTLISREIAAKLKLDEIALDQILTPSGRILVPRYLVNIIINNEVRFAHVQVVASDIGEQGIDMLIGMNIISHGDFVITNYMGTTQFSFRFPSQGHIAFHK